MVLALSPPINISASIVPQPEGSSVLIIDGVGAFGSTKLNIPGSKVEQPLRVMFIEE